MSFLCEWLGHKPPANYSRFAGMGGGNYLTAEGPIVDGVGREHYRLYGMCPRCGEDYEVAMIHGHQLRAEVDRRARNEIRLGDLYSTTEKHLIASGIENDRLREEVEALRAERDALEKDAAKYRWGINNARWVRSEQEAYVAIPVAPDADLSCAAMRDAAIDAELAKVGAA